MVQSALEVGLHKERFYRNDNDTVERSSFLKRLMACVVDLDKRCSFIATLPYHLRDREVDDSVLDLVRCLVYLSHPNIESFHPVRDNRTNSSNDSTGAIRFCRQWSI